MSQARTHHSPPHDRSEGARGKAGKVGPWGDKGASTCRSQTAFLGPLVPSSWCGTSAASLGTPSCRAQNRHATASLRRRTQPTRWSHTEGTGCVMTLGRMGRACSCLSMQFQFLFKSAAKAQHLGGWVCVASLAVLVSRASRMSSGPGASPAVPLSPPAPPHLSVHGGLSTVPQTAFLPHPVLGRLGICSSLLWGKARGVGVLFQTPRPSCRVDPTHRRSRHTVSVAAQCLLCFS